VTSVRENFAYYWCWKGIFSVSSTFISILWVDAGVQKISVLPLSPSKPKFDCVTDFLSTFSYRSTRIKISLSWVEKAFLKTASYSYVLVRTIGNYLFFTMVL